MKKRILSILLVCCMVLTMLPTAAFAALSDSLGNTPRENQAILEQLSALTGGSSDQVLSMLNALGLLDEDGNFKVDQTITLDGQVLTLAAVMELLENPATDLTRIADVDGTPVALGDLKTMIQIEQELQRIKDTYFSGREFTGEALENLNSLMEQLELQGISLQYSASATKPEGVETVDMRGMMSQTLEDLANNKWSSGAFTVYGGKPVGFSYRIQKGQLSEYITGVEVSIGETSEVVEQSDGSYKLTYDVGSTFSLSNQKITVEVKTKGGNPDWRKDSYSYGDLLGMIELYDAENLVFYDGDSYADHCQLKLIKTVPVPTIKRSMTAPSYVEEVKNTTVLYDDLFIPLLTESYTGGSANNSDFVALSNTIGILEGARNLVLPSGSSQFYQPYQIDASIEFSWSGDIAAYNGPAPYGYYNSKNPRPYAPFCLTEYKLDETPLTPIVDGKKTEDCTIKKGSTVSISLQSTTKNRVDEKYYLPFELYLKNVNNNIHNSTTTAKTSGVHAKLVDTDKPTIQSVTAPEGTYASGQHVPITVTFNEFVDLRNARVTINGEEYTAAELSMNDYGVTAMLWYPVQDADATTVTVNGMTGVEDVFGHELNTAHYPSKPIADVALKSVLMRNAPTALTADYANGKASFTMNANMAEAYMTVYSNYHTPDETEPKEAPFRLELRDNSTVEAPAYLQVYLDTKSGGFIVSDYEIAPSASNRTYTVTLQANEGTKDDPDWVNVLPLTRQFTVQRKVSVSTVNVVPEANDADYTISLATTVRPTLQAKVLGKNGETASYTTGKWSSSDPLIATINENTGLVATTGAKVGSVTFTFTADNGTEDTADDVKGESKPYTVTAGDSLALVIPGNASIVTRLNQPATVLWSSNAALMAPNKEFHYRIDLYEGNYTNEAELSASQPVATYTVGKDKNSVRIEENVLSKLSNGNTPAYTVLVSMPHPNAGGEDVRLSALAWIIVQAPPAAAKLTPPQSIYLKDTDGAVNIDWSVENATAGASPQPTLTITRVTEDNTTQEVARERLSGPSGSFSLPLQSVKAGNLKDTYQVVLSVENPGEESPSTDSFPLYVYDADALKVQDDEGNPISALTMDNTSKVSGTLPTDTAKILQLRQELGLIEYIGINYNEYGWNSFKDGIKWVSSNNNAISVNYKQGGLYEDIRNFSFASYLPETKMALSGRANGTATVTAIHAATGMSASVQVTAETLQNKFYLFQLTPAAETTLQYTDGTGAPKTVTTNRDGVLALYEPNGIASEVSLRSGTDKDIYLGTIYKENLRSGERDATKLQLYPLNTFTLRQVARASVTLITPGGDPLANKTVTVRGGVYKNGGYCETALLGSKAGALVSGITGDTYTTDAAGTITVYLDSTQFWSAEKGESSTTALSALDQLEYILEISEIDGDNYCPLLLTVNGKLGVDDVMRTAEGIVSLEGVPAEEKNKPFIVAQSVDYGLANGQKVDVRSSTGKIGPNSSFKTATLHTTMFLWGEDIANAKNYSLKLADEYGVLPAAQSSSTKQYPFSSIPVAENDLTLTEATMTTSGWIADGKDVGMKTQLSLNGSLLQEKIMPFRVVDLTRVPKVTEDERVTGILATMSSSSGVNQVDFGGVGDSSILKVLTGRLDDLSGPVDSSVFKMIITPSEDPSVFRAMIWAGYNTLEMEDMDYSEDGVALGANVLTQNLEVGVPGTGDLSQMAQGTYDPKGEYKANSLADNVTSTDLNLQLEGFYEAEIRYNAEKKEWEVFTVGGGFTAGVGVGFTFSVNAMAGPVPLTATFELGGAIQLDFRTAVRYGQQGQGTELAWSDPTATAVNDFLTTLRINAYVHAFGGIGFDYSVVALKIGLFGNLDVDSQNKFLSRTYLADKSKRQINGQALGIQSEVGIKFVATFLFISYEAVIASGTLGATRTFNNWKTIDDYWNSATSGLSLASLQMAAAQSGMQVASASATLQSRDYLEQYARTWGQPQQRMMLFSLNSPSGLESIQTNANPTSYPQLSDDGKILAYINDGNSSNIYDSRAHFSTLNDGVYTPSSQIDNLTEFPGYGDTSVSLSGTESFAAAAWVRMGTELPGKNAGNAVTLEEQNLLMNSTEIVVSVYNGTNWTSTRLTKDGTPDLAPATAVGGDDKAIVFWRSVYTPDPVSASGSNNLLNFTTRDCIMYSCYDSSNGRWSDAKMLYNGATGSVKALQAAMLPDGTAMAVYSLDRSGTGDTSAYEIAYCTVAADGTPGTAMLATCDSNLDENPQVVAANFGIGDDRFVIGWHSVRDGSSDIQLLAVDGSGTMSNSFPGSLSALTSSGNAVVGGDFRFASLSGDHRSINDLTIVWNETVNDDKGAVDHGILKAAKLRYAENTYTLSAPLELAELPKRTLADHFDAYVSGPNQVQAAIQANFYDDENPQVIGNVTVPGEKTILYTATSDFITDAVAVEQIGVDYATLALNSLTPIRFTIRNTGLNDVTSLTVSLGGGETATLTEKLLPNESTTLTVWHHVKDRVTDPSYTITADAGINETGTVYLDYPDIGISQMEVIAESAGKRTVRMTLYNSSAATLADGKNRKVKIAFYADDLHTKHAEVACATNGVSVRDNEITISENSALARIDQGTFTLDLTYDLGKYMNSIGKTEISNVGTYLYAEAWAEGKIGGTGSNQRLPEYDGSDSEASVHMTGALARTGEKLTMDVTQGNDGNGRSTAAITLRNNCLQSQNSAELVATLLDAAGTVLETKKTGIGGAISGETFRAETVTFSRLGTRVVVRAAVPGNDLLTFEGLAVGLGDFTANGTNYTYTLQNDSGATSTLVTAVSGNGEPVSINGQALSTGGSATVAIPNSGTTDIVVGIGAKTYTLTILRNSGTGGNQGGGGSGYSYYTIKATAGTDGSISPSGDVSVRKGRDQTFAITPDKGYAVANVKIDGKSIGAVKSYTFENVRRTHTIEVIFMKANGTPQTGVFVDVATGSYYEDAVDWAVENGITKGTDDTHFSPDGICTRAQAVTFLWRTAGSPKPETRAMPFTDVPVGSYYYDAVLWAVENGITKGTSDTTFSPNMTCSRAQIVAFLWRSEKSPAAGTANPFADVKSDAYYADAVLWAVKENITKGTTSTTFSPNAGCTRAQIVTFLYRAYQGK
ncbi:S-layer homology domain-containing protein [Flintibacter faecis]|uniref:S-layer homology domain-containing protein n=1 Tax=Flintibacter faecis TaxID=2763047 RepID=A0A8J6M1X8_9FIRM|nr:S-layer homology domain-containing protein [Flintibacter faecis]MBC5717614.1 S-layer homology domain-containing protein [Flintibacter faecis]